MVAGAGAPQPGVDGACRPHQQAPLPPPSTHTGDVHEGRVQGVELEEQRPGRGEREGGGGRGGGSEQCLGGRASRRLSCSRHAHVCIGRGTPAGVAGGAAQAPARGTPAVHGAGVTHCSPPKMPLPPMAPHVQAMLRASWMPYRVRATPLPGAAGQGRQGKGGGPRVSGDFQLGAGSEQSSAAVPSAAPHASRLLTAAGGHEGRHAWGGVGGEGGKRLEMRARALACPRRKCPKGCPLAGQARGSARRAVPRFPHDLQRPPSEPPAPMAA